MIKTTRQRVNGDLMFVDHWAGSGRWYVRVGSIFARVRVVFFYCPKTSELELLEPFTDGIDN